MPKPEEDLIDRLTQRPEVRKQARALLLTVRSKTGPGTGYDIGDAKSGLPAICTYIASKSANYADITRDVAQKASCLAPKTFVSTLKTVETALRPSNKTPNEPPRKSGEDTDRTAYASLISDCRIGRPKRVEKWMKEAQAALVALPRFQRDFASRIAEPGAEVRVAVFYWVCRTIDISGVQHVQLVNKYGVSLKVSNRLVKMLEDECVDLKESILATLKEMRKKMAKVGASASASGAAAAAAAAATASTSKTQTSMSTPSHSRSASPTKSAMRDARLTPSLPSSATKRKVAFSDMVSASEDDEGVFSPETPSKKRPRRAAAAASSSRVMPMSKAASASSSEEGTAGEDIEMSDAAIAAPTSTPPRTRTRPVAASTSTSGAASPIAGPSTPRRPKTAPTHAYRTPPSARMQLLSGLSDDEDEAATVRGDAEAGEEEEDGDDDTLPPSRRFRPVFLDRAQWAQRAPRLAHDRAAAERRTRELVGRWGYPFELLRRASTKAPAG